MGTLCTDGSAAARHIGVRHHATNASGGQRAIGHWHINSVNGYHSQLKRWLRQFNGVASSYLRRHHSGFRAME